MKPVERIHSFYYERPSYAFDLIRIFLGVTLFLKGISFIYNRDYLAALIGDPGNEWFWPLAVAHYVILAHLIGGIGMILGLLTRISVIVQIPVLLGAILYIHLPKVIPKLRYLGEVQNLEYAVLVLFLMVLIAIRGAGNWSLDHLAFGEKEEKAGAGHAPLRAAPGPR